MHKKDITQKFETYQILKGLAVDDDALEGVAVRVPAAAGDVVLVGVVGAVPTARTAQPCGVRAWGGGACLNGEPAAKRDTDTYIVPSHIKRLLMQSPF